MPITARRTGVDERQHSAARGKRQTHVNVCELISFDLQIDDLQIESALIR